MLMSGSFRVRCRLPLRHISPIKRTRDSEIVYKWHGRNQLLNIKMPIALLVSYAQCCFLCLSGLYDSNEAAKMVFFADDF
jgi:hypothetical protein